VSSPSEQLRESGIEVVRPHTGGIVNNHTLLLLSAVAVTCLFPVLSFAHDRGLDRYGCHHHRKHGGYYCHRGAMVGQSFKSQQEMLAAMKRKEKAPSSSKRPSTQNESKPR
jgi:hypothetical protein